MTTVLDDACERVVNSIIYSEHRAIIKIIRTALFNDRTPLASLVAGQRASAVDKYKQQLGLRVRPGHRLARG